MAIPKLPKCMSFLLIFVFFTSSTNASLVHVPLRSVSDVLIQSALDSLNEYSPTRNTYKSGNLISAQKLLDPPYVTYKLTLNLEAICNEATPCPREVCAIDLRQHDLGVIDVQRNSIVCMYLYPQSDEAQVQQSIQDGSTQDVNTQEQEILESYDKKSSNPSVQLDHEVQTVADGSERPFIAVRAIDQKYCPGCPYELNPTLPGLAAYSEQVVSSMDESGRSDYKYKVVNIVRVTRAVPPGSNVVVYELLLEIGETNCRRIGVTPRSECSLLPNVPVRLCLVTFEQRPWQQDSRKIIRNNCTDFPESEMIQNAELTSHAPYTSESSPDQSEANDGQTSALEKKFGSLASSIDEFFDVETNPVSTPQPDNTQVPVKEENHKKVVLEKKKNDIVKVEGFKDKYREYNDFLDNIEFDMPAKNREPEPDPRTPVNEELIRPEVVMRSNDGQSSREARSDRRERRATNRKEVAKALAQKAVSELDEIDDDDRKRILVEVLESKPYPGDRRINFITMKVAESNCSEKEIDCRDKLGAKKICRALVQVHDYRVLETAKVLHTHCFDEDVETNSRSRRNSRAKRGLLGAPAQKSVKDPMIKNYVDKALRKLSKESDSENEPYLVEIVEATEQVVSGLKYKIKVRLGDSTCKKGKVGNNCGLKSDSEIYDYVITAWTQPWKENGNLDLKIESPQKNAKRVRRSQNIPGGVNQADVNDEDIVRFANHAVTKYNGKLSARNEPILVEVLQATKQVVSGMKYTMIVKLGESTCPKGVNDNCLLKSDSETEVYKITVWSQPWIDKGNAEVTFAPYDGKSISKRSLRGKNYSPKMLKLGQGLDRRHVDIGEKDKFERFMIEHGKSYESEKERNLRFRIFLKNLRRIEDLRANEQGTAEYGATMFADLTYEEFKAKHLGLKLSSSMENEIPLPKAKIPNVKLPESFDWRDKNVITEVKNQGSCGSCWAFSVTGNIEALNAIKHGKLLSLSEQELVDCDTYDDGCNGGLPINAYKAIEQMGGLETESDYPYDAENEKCHFNKSMARVNIVSGVNITSNETQMAQWLIENGPITIGINANAMQFYMGGISHPFKFLCSADDLDHGVLIVGFGVHRYPIFKNKTLPYWIIKNSWGSRWGEQGYYRVYRGDGTCGVNRMASSAVVA